jgi:Na+-transporting NADH:ubiquinone oxidoreductase subunit A
MTTKSSLFRTGVLTLTFSFFSWSLSAQSLANGNALGWALAGIAVVIFLVVVSSLAGNLISIEAQKRGVDMSPDDFSVFAGFSKLFKKKIQLPEGADGLKILSKGHDILLEGEAEHKFLDREVKTFALQPKDYIGMQPIPKLMIEVGDEVKAGSPVFFDKTHPEIIHVSPVSGEFIELRRGEKRSIQELVFLADKDQKAVKHTVPSGGKDEIIDFMKKTGAWTLLRQRPYDTIPSPDVAPKNIFISTFDSAPLAPDSNFIVNGQGDNFQKGLDILGGLTEGKVYLGLNAKTNVAPELAKASGVVKTYFHGKHPAGNVGVQIHHTAPLAQGDVVWYLGVQEVITLGRLFNTGEFVQERIIAVTGAELEETGYVRTYQGAAIADLVGSDVGEGVRYISGDVLSGKEKEDKGYVGMFDDQVTVIDEGDEYELFGWLLPLKLRPSVSGTMPNRFFPDIKFRANTNTHGEKRAFVVTGQYEKLLPMDIHVQHLMKAILNNDFERMEGLGLFELSEEDVALCEFACTSKQPLQKILREGLEVMREQS